MAVPALIVPGPSGPPQLIFSPQASNPTFTGTTATFDATKYFNSGILQKDSTFNVAFPSTGTFKFICLFHPGMTLSVSVVSSGTTDTQATLDTRAQSELQATLAAGESAAATIVPAPAQPHADGTATYHAVAGTESTTAAYDADVMRFFPPSINIKAGDTIEWSNTTDVPHTVAFGVGSNIPPLVNPLAQPSGPPLLALNPAVFAPAGGTTYNGTGVVNTGALGQGFVATSASITFTTPGTYTYVCLVHADQAMTGTVVVTGAAPAAPAPTPTAGAAATGISAPNTGTGPEPVGGPAGWLLPLLVAMLMGGSFVAAGVRVRGHRRG